MAKVDVIVPAYNAARFLPLALDSVIAQTFTDWRILLIDDGSEDSTAEIGASYQARLGAKLTYIRQQNRGLPAARNTALRHATAELCALLDADDVWLPDRLAESLKAFEGRPEVGLSYGFIDRIDSEGRYIDEFTRRNRHGEGDIATYIYRRMLDLPCPTVSFRLRCIEQTGSFDENLRSTEDRDLWLRIAQRFRVALVPRLIAHYRVSPQAMTANPDRMLQAQLQFIAKHYREPGCGWLSRRIALGNIYRQHAEALATRGEKYPAARSALRAIRFYPFQASTARTALSLLLRWAAGRVRGSRAHLAH